jgi:hypothetical protein
LKAGANGAVTLVFKNGQLFLPSTDDSNISQSPDTIKQILKNFRPREKDVTIISEADTERVTENSGIMRKGC